MDIDAERTDNLAQLKKGAGGIMPAKSHDEEHVDI